MAFINLIFTAIKLRKLRDVLVEEKTDALKIARNEEVKRKFRFRHFKIDIFEAIKRFLRRILCINDDFRIYRFFYLLFSDGSYENYVLKSIFGFISGIILTYILYFFFIFQLNIKLTSATIACSLLGCILTVGLAFSSNIRCIVLLTLPQFFSKRGRQALLAYAFILAITGPGQNTLNNMGILSESLACGQEQLKQVVKQIIDVIKKPFVAIKETIKKVIQSAKEVIKKIKEILVKIKKIIMTLVRVIKSGFEFLGRLINVCNKELGTPFERCSNVFESAIIDCNAKLGPLFNWLCSLTYIVKSVCYVLKPLDFICTIVDFISDSVVGVIIKKVKTFIRHIKTLFYIRIKFSHSFEYETVASKNLSQVGKAIFSEIKDRSSGILAFFKFITSAVMLFFLYLIVQVAYYRLQYLTNERFDNIYITQYFRDLDRRRAKLGKETVLPLNKKERNTYIPIAAAGLAYSERRELTKSISSLATASIKLAIHMAADYSLYWILSMVSHHGKYQSKIQAPNLPVAHIAGEGFLAKLLKAIVDAFQPVGFQLEIDTVPCLPIPIPPDFDRYIQIGITLMFCWILTIFEPYGLRFRNYIMGYYFPVRAKQRTIWLYNHILRSRSSFLMFARRQLRRKFGKKRIDHVTCKEQFREKLSGICIIFKYCLGSDLQLTCLLCGEVFRETNKNNFIKCQTPNCPGLFCQECYEDLRNICPICLSPIEYGDLDDIDEEKDSSDDEPIQSKPLKRKKKCFWCPCKQIEDDDDENQSLLDREADNKLTKEDSNESDTSTDYSYQYDKDHVSFVQPSQTVFKDVEKQHIPDYASMENFQDQEPMETGKQLNAFKEQDDYEDYTEKTPLLSQECQCASSSTDNKKFEIIPSSECACSDLYRLQSCSTNSFMSSSSTMITDYCYKSKFKYKLLHDSESETQMQINNVIPNLDLSSLGSDKDIFPTPRRRFVEKFSNVSYKEECETSCHELLQESSSSMTNLLSLSHMRDVPQIRRRPVKQASKNIRNDTSQSNTFSSMTSYELDRAQNRKIKKYFKATKAVYPNTTDVFANKKRFSVENLFRRLLSKRKKSNNCLVLPLNTDDIDKEIKIRTNDSKRNRDILDINFKSLTHSNFYSDTFSEIDPQNSAHRIRDSQCSNLINCNFIGRIFGDKNVPSLDSADDIELENIPTKPEENVKKLLSKYSLSVEDFTPNKDPGPSTLSNTERNRSSTEKYNSNTKHSIQNTLNTFLLEQFKPLSSESGVSEATCHALFGDECFRNLKKDILERKQAKLVKSNSMSTNITVNKSANIMENISEIKIIEGNINYDSLEIPKKEIRNTNNAWKTEHENLNQLERNKTNSSLRDNSKTSILFKNHATTTCNKRKVSESTDKLVEIYQTSQETSHDSTKLSPEMTLLSENVNIPTLDSSFYSQLDVASSHSDEIKELYSHPDNRRNYSATRSSVVSNDDYISFERPERDVNTSRNLCSCQWDRKYKLSIENHETIDTQTMNDSQNFKTTYKDESCQTTNSVTSESTCYCHDCCTKRKFTNGNYRHSITPLHNFHRLPYHEAAVNISNNFEKYSTSHSRDNTPSPPTPFIYCQCTNCCGQRTFHQSMGPRDGPIQILDNDDLDQNAQTSFWSQRRQDIQNNYQHTRGDLSKIKSNPHELAYQYNDDYKDLVQELEETLHSRNKNRVSKIIEEFERRSQQNQSLEKPINDYSQTSINENEATIIRRLNELREVPKCCQTKPCFCNIPSQLVRHPSSNYINESNNQLKGLYHSDKNPRTDDTNIISYNCEDLKCVCNNCCKYQ